MTTTRDFTADALDIDCAATTAAIEQFIRSSVTRLRRRGAVIGLSGGIDSSVVAALAVRALGPGRVFGLLMPEADSSTDSRRLGQAVADMLGIRCELEDIGETLRAAGCYRRRDDAMRAALPEYGEGYSFKLVLPDLIDRPGYSIYSAIVRRPDGETLRVRLPAESYLGIVAATNFKQRVRKMMEYYHADRLHYAVLGTPNLLEYDQGFFVKNGDGAADIKPIAHLYKSQVYRLAEHLGIPQEIRRRPPTTDTFPMPQAQDEFYFGLPLEKLDVCLFARNHGVPPAAVGSAVGFTPEQVERVYRLIDSRRAATAYLQTPPLVHTAAHGA